MLYLGIFSFDENFEDPRHGHFTCMVEAQNPEGAEKAFRKLIMDVRKKKQLFSSPADIFLDTFIEVADLPKGGVVTSYASFRGESEGGISTYLPHDDNGGCQGFFYYPEDRPDIAEKMDVMESFDSVPFITFEPTPAQRKAAFQKEQMEKLEKSAQQAAVQKRKPFSKKSHW